MDDKIVGWFTSQGKHIPIYEGESKEDAFKRNAKEIADKNETIKQDQIAKHQKEVAELNATPGAASFTQDGELNKDGSARINFLHIANPKTKNFGSQYGQNLEPSGEYMSFISEGQSRVSAPNYHYGVITFKKPLVLEHKSTGETGWKKDLSEMFGGKTGKALSTAIKKAGYDGVMTWETYRGKKSWVEIVNLSGAKD